MQCHDNLLTLISKKVQEEFTAITTTYDNQVPELQSKLNHTKSQITLLQQEIKAKCTKNRKRGNTDQADNQNKKLREETSEQPSASLIEIQIKQAMGQFTLPNRGRGFGRGRGHGQRGHGRGKF